MSYNKFIRHYIAWNNMSMSIIKDFGKFNEQ